MLGKRASKPICTTRERAGQARQGCFHQTHWGRAFNGRLSARRDSCAGWPRLWAGGDDRTSSTVLAAGGGGGGARPPRPRPTAVGGHATAAKKKPHRGDILGLHRALAVVVGLGHGGLCGEGRRGGEREGAWDREEGQERGVRARRGEVIAKRVTARGCGGKHTQRRRGGARACRRGAAWAAVVQLLPRAEARAARLCGSACAPPAACSTAATARNDGAPVAAAAR